MATFSGPKNTIKTPLLILDAKNPKSYPGSGTTWYDISGNNNHGTFINQPYWQSTEGGIFIFDGVDDRITTTLRYWGNNVTFSAWVKRVENVTYYNMFMGRYLPYFSFLANAQNFWSYYTTGVGQTVLYTRTLNNNTWYNFTYTITSDGTTSVMKNYTNGVLDTVGSYNGTSINGDGGAVFNGSHSNYDPGYYFTVGDGSSFNWYPFRGSIGRVEVYNEALTSQEILDNFNVNKYIYGYI
jgi:hypothetical protein